MTARDKWLDWIVGYYRERSVDWISLGMECARGSWEGELKINIIQSVFLLVRYEYKSDSILETRTNPFL